MDTFAHLRGIAVIRAALAEHAEETRHEEAMALVRRAHRTLRIRMLAIAMSLLVVGQLIACAPALIDGTSEARHRYIYRPIPECTYRYVWLCPPPEQAV